MPLIHNMDNGFPSVSSHNTVPIVYRLWFKSGFVLKTELAIVDDTDPKNRRWLKLKNRADEPTVVLPTSMVVCWCEKSFPG